MHRHSTIFKKYFHTSLLVISVSFLILGIMIVSFMIRYWKNEKHNLFSENAYGIADFIEGNSAVIDNDFYLYNEGLLKTFISTFASNLNADIFITDSFGKIIMHSSDKKDYINKKISERIISEAKSGHYEETGDLDGLYRNRNYVVSIPIKSKVNMSLMGMIFICTDAESFLGFYKDIIVIFVIASVVALAISFWVVRWMSYGLTEPLRKIAIVAMDVGKGNFTKRVEVEGDDEICKLGRVFNDMTDSLSRSEQVRRNFIANVSHELKTPMTTISGFVDGILDGTIQRDRQNYYLNIVSLEMKRLSRLVKTMLDLSKLDNGNIKLSFCNVDITNMLLSVIMTFEDSINKKNIKICGLETCKSVSLEVDQDMMYQVIYNLIENAVKFTDNDGYINISMTENSRELVLSIRNTGIGVSDEDKKFIFDKFFKTDKSRSIDKKGLGLGLYMVNKIVKLHEGSIEVESVQGEYTQFNLRIPKKHG